MALSKRAQLRAELATIGWSVDTYSPGDGATRYRFFSPGAIGPGVAAYTASGSKEASAYARGALDATAVADSAISLAHSCGGPDGDDLNPPFAPKPVECGSCGLRWCERCDPCPSAACHRCHGRGHTLAPLSIGSLHSR